MSEYWELLDLEPTGDVLAIKRAYARQLKQNRPDDAPEAYQALRQAYEWAMREADWIRKSVVEAGPDHAFVDQDETWQPQLDSMTPGLVGREWGAEGDDEPIESDQASALLERWAERLLDPASADMESLWPTLRQELDLLPLNEQAASSALFADFVLQNENLLPAWLARLAQHFQWGRDYRDAEWLGAGRLALLRERWVQEDPAAFRDAQLIEQANELLRLDWVLQHRGKLSGQVYAALAHPVIRSQLKETYDKQHRALDISFVRWEAMSAAASRAVLIRLFLVLACAIPVAYLLIKPEQGLLRWMAWPAFFGGAYWFAAWGLGRSLPAAGDEMGNALSALSWLRTDISRIVAAIALPLAVALIARDAVALPALQSIFPDKALVGAGVLICVAALLISPENREERRIAFPMLGALSFAITSLTGTEGSDWMVAMGVAAAWMGLGGWIYSRYHELAMQYFRSPWETLRPRAWWGWVLLVVAFKFALALLAFLLILALPITLRVIARYWSANTAWLAIGLAVALAVFADPAKAASLSLPILVLTVAAFTWLQAGANRIARKMFGAVPTSFFQDRD
jgi:hypothetical protein